MSDELESLRRAKEGLQSSNRELAKRLGYYMNRAARLEKIGENQRKALLDSDERDLRMTIETQARDLDRKEARIRQLESHTQSHDYQTQELAALLWRAVNLLERAGHKHEPGCAALSSKPCSCFMRIAKLKSRPPQHIRRNNERSVRGSRG